MLELSPDTGEMKAGEMDYLTVDTGGWPMRVHLQMDAIDGIVRDVWEDPDTGGLLLGRVTRGAESDDAESAEVWIERYRRSKAEAMSPFEADDLPAVGVYSNTGMPPSGVDGLALQIRTEERNLIGQFFVEGNSGEFEPRGPEFPFRGRMLESTAIPGPEQVMDVPNVRPPRLVPDFAPPRLLPQTMFKSLDSPSPDSHSSPSPEEHSSGLRAIWKPLLAAITLMLAVFGIFFFSWRGQQPSNATAAVDSEPFRPLGLYVDATAPEWRVTWNQNATPLVKPRGVGLFVREGEDQNRIDLSPEDLSSGSYRYKPAGRDVMFRLEVTDASGRVSAESFRVLRAGPPVGAQSPEKVATTKPESSRQVQENAGSSRLVQPKPVHRVAPVVSAGVRARIRGTVTMDVKVKVNAQGRVTAASPLGKHVGVEAYLAQRAVAAARGWRFTPAKQDGKAVAGTQTIRFSFER